MLNELLAMKDDWAVDLHNAVADKSTVSTT
jgi:hypothetical protein